MFKQKSMNVLLNDELLNLLKSGRLPARLNTSQVSALIGFQPHDIPVLVCQKLLRPLGKPAPSAIKYFAANEIEQLAKDTRGR